MKTPALQAVGTDHDDARDGLRALMDKRGWSKAEVARRMGLKASTSVSQWLRGIYRGDNENISGLARRLLATEQDADHLTAAGLDRLADLTVTDQVSNVAAHAQANADLTVVFGAGGGGKTFALKRYCAEHAGAHLATMSPAMTTPSAVLTRIAKKLYAGSAPETTAARLEEAVVARLSVGRSLLVVDEAHHLTQPLLDAVRCVYDEAGCGLVLAGNEPLWSKLARGDRAAQLWSRVGLHYHLGEPAPTDVLALAERLLDRPADGAGRKAVLAAGKSGGALRSVRKLIAYALILARGDSREDVTDQDLADAAELLGS